MDGNGAPASPPHPNPRGQYVDRWINALTANGGRESMCGWLVDRFGLSWQIVPKNIAELIAPPAALAAMLQMRKLDIAGLRAAAE